MANSLNQAFIRAYAKERETAHSRAAISNAESIAAEQQVIEDLIQRFDTATVKMPQPHLTSKQPARERVEAQVSSGKPSRELAMSVTAGRDAELELRSRIASEMLRAGDFQSEQIASLNSFFTLPTAPKSTPPTASPATVSPAIVTPATVTPATVSPAIVTPAAVANSSAIVANNQAQDIVQTQQSRSSKDQDVTAAAQLKDTVEPVTLPQPELPTSGFSRVGGIFRVDTPSQQAVSPVVRIVAEPPAKKLVAPLTVQKVTEHNHIDTTRIEAKHTDQVGTGATHAAQIAEAKHVESKLRHAKVRVFNPVWEVDQLQWPQVCMQLMDARMDSLTQVAKHLIDACQEGLQVLAVTSPQGGEGRTTVACCLARLAGSRGLKTAIVDGDIENPTLCLQTNLEIEKDWQAALINQTPLEEIAVHSIDDQITLVPLLSPIDQDELPVDDQRIANMLIELSESFDLVIVDMGHMNSPNGLMISLAEQGIVNAAIAVIDHRTSTTQRIETCIRRIRQAGVNSIGLVENFAA